MQSRRHTYRSFGIARQMQRLRGHDHPTIRRRAAALLKLD
jgi:hypothetical protein